MSDFVNYNKRGTELPPGCKDLTDMLKPSHRSYVEAELKVNNQPVVVRRGSVTGTFADIGQYVTMGIDSKEQSFSLSIDGQNEEPSLSFHFMRFGSDCKSIDGAVTFGGDFFTEQAMRDFFAERGFRAPESTATPPTFITNLPVHLIYRISPLPLGAEAITQIIRDVLRDVFGMGDDSRLKFDYCEVKQVDA